ncbi:MAG: putative DNA-binding domain-containing protein [Rhodospirillales bacterium]|nr:putative DNA-binding domain-containing protein [Rhodospirillales bacterium]
MPSLRELQRDFSAAVLGGAAEPAAASVLEDRLPPEQRLQVYRNHVRISLREALAATFPVVRRLVGEGYFATVARPFVLAHPPKSPVLADYGAAFPAFLQAAPNAPAYLADVARLEWALNLAYHAPDAPALSAQNFAGLAPDAYATLRLVPLASTTLIASPHPIQAIWRANQPDRDATVDATEAQTVLVWRATDGDAACRVLAPGEAAFFGALIAAASLGEAATAALAIDPAFELPTAIAGLLAEPLFQAPQGGTL